MISKVSAVGVVLFAAFHLTIAHIEACTTPNSVEGQCIDLVKCPSILQMLAMKPLPEDVVQFLRNSECGRKNQTILVCCTDHRQARSSIDESNGLLPEAGICGTTNSATSDRIFGGSQTRINEYPWMALIRYNYYNRVEHHCGGTLINYRYVLTAAHCIKAVPNYWIIESVRLGEWDTSKDPDCEKDNSRIVCANPHEDVPVEKIIVHPDYYENSVNQYFDIALIRLARNISYTDYIRPICLPIDDKLRDNRFDDNFLDIVGWGKTENSSRSDIKLKASIPVVPLFKCQFLYTQISKSIVDSQICAGGGVGVDSCSGDSGGPLIGATFNGLKVTFFIAGIVSYGPIPCGYHGWPSVYTRVGIFVDWIKGNMQP